MTVLCLIRQRVVASDRSDTVVLVDHIAALRGNLAAGSVEVGHVAGTATIEGGAAAVRIGEVAGIVIHRAAA